jgi:glyoxylase-like metal-dependent hydrolase (beta-lactamase superfamily II)
MIRQDMADEIPFVRDLSFEYGVLSEVSPNIRRLVAKNPGPFTYAGTGTYVIGRGRVAVIDPGPALAEHVDALLRGLHEHGEEVAHILITHTHLDHSPAAQLLAASTGAPTFGFGPHGESRHAELDAVEEGADWEFTPDHLLGEGDTLEGSSYVLQALHTPGHCSNHLCFALPESGTLFTGDHVMGWSTSVIIPPDGDMGQYLTHLRRLLARDDVRYLPTHGPAVLDPKPLVAALLRHRENREQQIVTHLARAQGGSRIAELVTGMYADVPRHLHPAAARSVFAHLLYLIEQGRVVADRAPSLEATYSSLR